MKSINIRISDVHGEHITEIAARERRSISNLVKMWIEDRIIYEQRPAPNLDWGVMSELITKPVDGTP